MLAAAVIMPSVSFFSFNASASSSSSTGSGTTFYLHDDGNGFGHYGKRYDWANTSLPYNPLSPYFISSQYQGIELNSTGTSSSFRWIAWPAAGEAVVISGYVNVTLYMSQTNTSAGSDVSFRVQLQNCTSAALAFGSVIAQATTAAMQLSPEEKVVLSIPVISPYTLQPGDFLVLNLSRTDSNSNSSVFVSFDYNSSPSSFAVSLSPRLGTISITLPPPSLSFDNQPYAILANVSDSLGSGDLGNATVTITGSSGHVYVGGAQMKAYINTSYTTGYIYRAALPYGNYTLNITASTRSNLTGYHEQQSKTASFTVLPSLSNFSLAVPGKATAGLPFQIRLTAYSDSGQVMTDFNGSAMLRFVRPNGTSLPPSKVGKGTVNFTSGISSVDEVLYASGKFTPVASNGTATGTGAPINVSASAVDVISVTPSHLSLTAGQQVQFGAVGLDSYGDVNTTWIPYWSVSGSIGRISGSGLFTATGNGTGEVTVTDNATGATSFSTIGVSPSSLFSLHVVPSNTTLLAGETYFFTAYGFDYYGNSVTLGAVVWQTDAGSLYTNGTTVMLNVTRSTMQHGWVEAYSGGLTSIAQFNVTASAYSPQELLQIPLQSWPSGSSYTLNLTDYFSNPGDPTDSQLEWSLTGGSSILYAYGSGIVGNTQVVLVPYSYDFGYAEINITVTNTAGYSVTETFQVHVLPRPHWINSLPQYMTVPANSYYSINLTYFIDCSPYQPTSISIGTSSPYVYGNGQTITYFFPSSTISGKYAVVLTATDPDNVSSSIVQIISVSSSSPPTVNTAGAPPSSLTIDRGGNATLEYPLETYFISQNTLTFEAVASGATAYVAQGNILHIYTQAASFVSNGTVLVMARSTAGEYAFLMIDLRIVSVVSPPSVLPLPAIYVSYSPTGSFNYALPLAGYVTDTYVPLDQVSVITDSAYITFNGGNFSLLFSMPAAPGGTGNYTSPYWYNSTVVFVGGPLQSLDSDSIAVSLNVHVSSIPPPGPRAALPPFLTMAENSVYTSLNLSDYIASPGGGSITYTASQVRNITVSVSGSGDVTIAPERYFYGNERVYFEASSGTGFYVFSILVMVYPIYVPPVVSLPSTISLNSSTTVVNLSAYIDNPNNEPLVIRAFGSGVTVVGDNLLIMLPQGVSRETVTVVVSTAFGAAQTRQVSLNLVDQFPSIYVILFYALLLTMIAVGAMLTYQRLIPKPFQLNSLLLIHNDGRLIAHSHRLDYGGVDRDILVGMFTAIQDFVSTSFPEMGGETQALNRIEFGKFSIFVIRGFNAFVLAIYSGQPPRGWPQQMSEALVRIERTYTLTDWDGRQESLPGLSDRLNAMFRGSFSVGITEE